MRPSTVRLCPAVRRANGALAGRTVRAAQGRWQARGNKTVSLRCEAALRPDEGDWSVQDPYGSRISRDGGRQRAREARPSRLLGLTKVPDGATTNTIPSSNHFVALTTLYLTPAVPADVRRAPRSGPSRCALVCAGYGRPVQNQLDQLTAGRHVVPPPRHSEQRRDRRPPERRNPSRACRGYWVVDQRDRATNRPKLRLCDKRQQPSQTQDGTDLERGDQHPPPRTVQRLLSILGERQSELTRRFCPQRPGVSRCPLLRKEFIEFCDHLFGRQPDSCGVFTNERSPINPSRPFRHVAPLEIREQRPADLGGSGDGLQRNSEAFPTRSESPPKAQ